jgi:hypothetical protein
VDRLSSGDQNLFKSLLISICSPEVEFVQEYDGIQNPFGPNHRHFVGVTNVTAFYLALINTIPDAVFKFLEPVKVYRNAEKDTFLSFVLSVAQTKTKKLVDLIQTQHTEGNKKNKTNMTTDTYTTNMTENYPDNAISSLTSSFGKASFSVTPLSTDDIKRTYHVDRYSFVIDRENKITRMCSLFQVMTELPRANNGVKATGASKK